MSSRASPDVSEKISTVVSAGIPTAYLPSRSLVTILRTLSPPPFILGNTVHVSVL